MSEMGAMAEKPGLFANLKDKLRKNFTVAGSKEKYNAVNKPLIVKVLANLSPKDREAASQKIQQEAFASAKTDVAIHWGAAVVATATAGLAGELVFNPKFQQFVRSKAGRIGEGLADAGVRARGFIDRVIGGKWIRQGTGRFTEAGNNLRNIDSALQQRVANNTATSADIRELKKLHKVARTAFVADQATRRQVSFDKMAQKIQAQQADAQRVGKAASEVRKAAKEAAEQVEFQKKLHK